MLTRSIAVTLCALACPLVACSSSNETSNDAGTSVGTGGMPSTTTSTGGSLIVLPDAARQVPSGVVVPDAFTKSELGGFALGEPITTGKELGMGSSGADGGTGCDVLLGVVRDFRGINETDGHPDFEAFDGKGVTPGLVGRALGTDGKPVYVSQCEANADKGACPYGQMTTSRAAFDQWYRYAENVNAPYLLYLLFEQNGAVFTFSSKAFFPLDDMGWGNSPHKSHHNFGFTTELHTSFEYHGGESFTFTGDDDVWVFVNGKLAIDLGGLHPEKSETLDLDASASALGIAPGNVYPLDLFHAERHSASSNFRVDTTLAFTNCGVVVSETPR